MSTREAVLVLVLLVGLSLGAGTVDGAGQPLPPDVFSPATTGPNVTPDDVVVSVRLHENGSATWHLEYRIALEGSDRVDAFESYRQTLERNRSAYLNRFSSSLRRAAADAEQRTNRSMAISGVAVEPRRRQLPSEYGVVVYRFTWHGFAATADRRLRAGDALQGFFLDDEQTTLLLAWPSEYEVTDVAPSPDDHRSSAVVWEGPIEFAPDEPRVVLTTTENAGALPGSGPVVAMILLIAIGGLALVTWRRGALPRQPKILRQLFIGTLSDANPELSIDQSLLTNEEQVLELLENRGGRIKQQEVVDALEWSETKTSEVVASLDEAGDLEVLRIGRENVLSLPENQDGSVATREDDA